MSIRTFIEFNHDYLHKIRERPQDFLAALDAVLRKNDTHLRIDGREFGIIRRGERHHSDSFELKIGSGIQSSEPESKKC
jgi:hypothetical protein